MRIRIASLFLIAVLAIASIGTECGQTRTRHSAVVYNQTFDVYRSDKRDIPLFFTANDTISGNFTVRNNKRTDLFVMDSFNFRHSTHDSAHSVFSVRDTWISDIYFSPSLADTFFFEFVNRDPDSLHSVTLYVNRTYWEIE